MLKAGQLFKYKEGVFVLHYDTPQIKGTQAEGTWTDAIGQEHECRVRLEDLKFYPVKNSLQSSFKIIVDTSEVDAAIAKLEKLQALQEATKTKTINTEDKIWTEGDLYVGLVVPYMYPCNNKGSFYKITGFAGDSVCVNNYFSTAHTANKDEMSVKEVLERLNQRPN